MFFSKQQVNLVEKIFFNFFFRFIVFLFCSLKLAHLKNICKFVLILSSFNRTWRVWCFFRNRNISFKSTLMHLISIHYSELYTYLKFRQSCCLLSVLCSFASTGVTFLRNGKKKLFIITVLKQVVNNWWYLIWRIRFILGWFFLWF